MPDSDSVSRGKEEERVGFAYMVKALQAGMVSVNCYGTIDQAMPFGGYKMSRYGQEPSGRILGDLNTKAAWIGVGEGGRR